MKNAAYRAAAAALLLATAVSGVKAGSDQFGVDELYPTKSGGLQWYSKWGDGAARTFTGVDPDDAWFDAAHGAASYSVDGKGLFYITGSTPRMYVHDPAKVQEWHDVEMTVYAMRVADDGTPYAGVIGVTRSNHGTTGPELSNLCDTRGYGGRLRYDGTVDFDKETSHPSATAVGGQPLFSGGMPKSRWIGYKHVTYDMPNGHVMNEVWVDLTDGANGGTWQKVDSFEDTGSNMGVGAAACKSGVDPALMLTDSDARPGSESGRPNATVYWRGTDVGTKGLVYKKMSVREITAAPAPPVVSAVAAASIGQTAATIGWATDKASYSQVDYGVSASYGASTTRTAAAVTAHSVPLSGLAAGAAYHYRVRSLDPATGLTAVSGDFTFTTQKAAAAPVISNVSAAASSTGATFTWATDKVSHSQVEYGLTAAYGTLSYQSSATGTSHSLTVSGLRAGVTYHYRVKSLDGATGLTGVSGDFTFTTPAPATAAVISNVLASNVTSSAATITWNTTTVSHSQVDYGLSTSYGAQSYQSTATGTSHSIPLSGLRTKTLYHYRVKSLNSATGATAVSGDYTFKT